MIVLKFGGTSVQDAPSQNQALDIVFRVLDRAPLVVSSAMSGVTNDLIRLTELASSGQEAEAATLLRQLEERHLAVMEAHTTGPRRDRVHGLLDEVWREVKSLTRGMLLLGECSPRVYDAVVGSGELLSTRLLLGRCQELGREAELLDARELVITDDHFGEAAVLWAQTNERIQARVRPQPGKILITQGFIGSTVDGVMTILGRGGSDYSASIFGSALNAETVEIWTDVDGILTTDPRYVPGARTLEEISYAEAAELAYFGAKVIHPATIQPAVDKRIPVWVKNTKNPNHPGTVILPETPHRGPRAFAIKKNAFVISVTSSRMLNAHGFMARLFDIFRSHRIAVDLVATSEVSVSVSVDRREEAQEVLEDLEKLGTVNVQSGVGILCLVGPRAWTQGRELARVFAALADMTVHLVSLGASETNLSLVLNEADLPEALRRVHREFFGV